MQVPHCLERLGLLTTFHWSFNRACLMRLVAGKNEVDASLGDEEFDGAGHERG